VEIVCPKCRMKGTVKVIKQKKPQNTYKYVVVDHQNTKHIVSKELMVEIIERLLDENYELKTRIAKLEEKNAELREKVEKLMEENIRLKVRADLYDEMVKHSIIVRYVNIEDLDKLKKMLESGELYMLRIIPYEQRIDIEYADIKQL